MDQQADARNLEHFIAQHRPQALSLATRLVGGDHAEDLVQEALLRVLIDPEQSDRVRDPRSWLMGIVRHLAYDRVRSWVRERRITERLLAWTDTETQPPRAVDAMMERYEMRELVHQAIAMLSEGQREAVTGFYLNHLSVRDLALALGTSAGAVKVRLHAARRELRTALASLGEDLALGTPLCQESAVNHHSSLPVITQPPSGWFAHTFPLGAGLRLSYPASGQLRLHTAENNDRNGISQFIDAAPFRGAGIRFRARMRVQEGDNAFVQLIVMRRDAPHAVFTSLENHQEGSDGWKNIELLAKIDASAVECLLSLVATEGAMADFSHLTIDSVASDSVVECLPHRRYHCHSSPANLDFSEGLNHEGLPQGWLVNGSQRQCALLKDPALMLTLGNERSAVDGFTNLMQQVADLSRYRGRQVAATFTYRTQAGVEAWPWLRVDGRMHDSHLDNGPSRRLAADNGWQTVRMVADIGATDRQIAFGVVLRGPGFVDLSPVLIETTKGEAVTTRDMGDFLPPQANPVPINLDFAVH